MRPILKRRLVLAALGLALAAGASPVGADTDSAPGQGCAGSSIATEVPAAPIPLTSVLVAELLQSTLLPHPCTGPLFLRGTIFLEMAPTALESAAVLSRVRATCLGGGCPVTGAEIVPAPGSSTRIFRDPALPPTLVALPLTAVFPDLPAGTYQLEILAVGLHASAQFVEVWVLNAGFEATARRTIPEP